VKRPKRQSSTIPFLVPDAEYARVAEAQRNHITALAGKIQNGEALNVGERVLAAEIVRAWAKQIPSKQPRKRGQAPKIDAGPVAILYAQMVNRDGKKKTHAIAELAESYDCSEQTIKNALNKYGAAAMRMIPKKRES
jgi:hypothetical protein